jgi:hypothetical protein
MRWVLQTPRIWEQETTQPNQPKQTKISPGKRTSIQDFVSSLADFPVLIARCPSGLLPVGRQFVPNVISCTQTAMCRFGTAKEGEEGSALFQ